MKGTQLRLFAILVLALANGILAFLWLSRNARAAEAYRQESRNLSAVLENNGVRVAEDIVWPDTSAYSLLVKRDGALEAAAAQALLGLCETEELAGEIVQYKNETGEIRFRQGGVWDASWRGSADTLRALADRLGLQNIDTVSDEQITQSFDGLPVVEAGLSLRSEDGGMILSGSWILGEPGMLRDTLSRPAPACLLAYLGQTESPDFAYVESAALVYYLQPASQRLTPVWRLATDIGAVLLDAVSGERVMPLGTLT